jgi:hypothetical protein
MLSGVRHGRGVSVTCCGSTSFLLSIAVDCFVRLLHYQLRLMFSLALLYGCSRRATVVHVALFELDAQGKPLLPSDTVVGGTYRKHYRLPERHHMSQTVFDTRADGALHIKAPDPHTGSFHTCWLTRLLDRYLTR